MKNVLIRMGYDKQGSFLSVLKVSSNNDIILSKINSIIKIEKDETTNKTPFNNYIWDNLVKTQSNNFNNTKLLDISRNSNEETINEQYAVDKKPSQIFFHDSDSDYSIIPFLLIRDIKYHRYILKDDEIQYNDYSTLFIKGRIQLHIGNVKESYQLIKEAIELIEQENSNGSKRNLKELQSIIYKWMCFVSFIVLLYGKEQIQNKMKCINFIEQIKKDIQEPLLSEMNIDNKLTYDDKIQPLLSCLSRRTITNNYMFLSLNENEGVNSIYLLCKQIEYCLNKAFLFECNLIECYWILFLISIFRKEHKDTMLFNCFSKWTPMNCIKIIKQKDKYYGYILYMIYNTYLNENQNYPFNQTCQQLILKYPNRIEGYLLLLLNNSKNNENQLKEIFNLFDNYNVISFDYLSSYYLVIKALILCKFKQKSILSMKILEQLYIMNNSNPNILFLLCKIGIKSKEKELILYSQSILSQLYFLLSNENKNEVYFWLGKSLINEQSLDLIYVYHYYKAYTEKNNSKSKHSREANSLINQKQIKEFMEQFIILKNKVKKLSKEQEREQYISSLILECNKLSQLSSNFYFNKQYFLCFIYLKLEHKDKKFVINQCMQLNLSNNVPYYYKIKVLILLWKYLKDNIMLKFKLAYYIYILSSQDTISIKYFIKGSILLCKSLILMNKKDEGIQILLNLMNIFIHFNINEINNNCTTHEKYKQTLNLFSKSNVYYKTKYIIDSIINSYTNSKEKEYYDNFDEKNIIDNEDLLETYLEKKILKTNIPKEKHTFISFISNPIVLYKIAKYCALVINNKEILKTGIQSIEDFDRIRLNNHKSLLWKAALYMKNNDFIKRKDLIIKLHEMIKQQKD